MFKGNSNDDQLNQIVKFLGSEKLYSYLSKYGLKLTFQQEVMIKKEKGRAFESLINDENRHLATEEAIDLLSRMLLYDFVSVE